jgi:DNA polymerase elongation subunit (family B)
MRLEGWLLDISFRDNEALLWVKTEKARVQLLDTYSPDIYVLPEDVSNERFMELFDEHENILCIEKKMRFKSISDTKKSLVLRVCVDSVDHYRGVLRLVEKYAEVFDSDISHTQRYLADRSLVPFGTVLAEVNERNQIQSISQVPVGLDVEPPSFKVLRFEVSHEEKKLNFITLDEGMQQEYRFSGGELETIQSFTAYIMERDPDMLCCLESDMKKLLKLGIKHKLPILGVFSRKSFHLSEGRVFLNLISYRRMSLAGMVERIQYTREVPRISSNWAAGRAIESRQSYEARNLGYLIPRRGFFQPVMSLHELLRERDHGSLIFAPTVGLHENVAALDFESMFPHLILKNNISYENIRSDEEHEGFLLAFTRDTLERRLYFKHLKKDLKDSPMEWFWCETRQQALKEILFCTYGYSGCWANKFGNMDTFMEINKVARKNLVSAMNIARACGFHTLYGNSDSLFLQKQDATRENFDDLAEKIKEKLELPITVENHFKYLVLLPQKSGKEFGAINRYYGLRYDGELVCRGIELRRRNTPSFIADRQREAIQVLLRQETAHEVLSRGVMEVEKVISKASQKLKQGLVPISELEAKTILRRRPSKYKARLPHVAAAEALDINGAQVERGSVISFIYVDSEHSNPFRRVSPAGFQKKYDAKKYVKLLEEAGKSILLPFLVEKREEPKSQRLDSFF